MTFTPLDKDDIFDIFALKAWVSNLPWIFIFILSTNRIIVHPNKVYTKLELAPCLIHADLVMVEPWIPKLYGSQHILIFLKQKCKSDDIFYRLKVNMYYYTSVYILLCLVFFYIFNKIKFLCRIALGIFAAINRMFPISNIRFLMESTNTETWERINWLDNNSVL